MKRLLIALLLTGCGTHAVVSTPSPTDQPTSQPAPTATISPQTFVPFPTFDPNQYKSPVPAIPIQCTEAFCYPRLGITGPIVDDASRGAVDPLLTIVRDTTYSYAIAISAHGYTSFGNIAQWMAGDDVQVYGQHYTVFAAFTVACGQHVTVDPSAKLFLQTSLNSEPCSSGKHLDIFVMAR